MNSEQPTSYMLLFRGTHWDKDLSPEQIQDVMGRWVAWFDGLTQQGKIISAHPLVSEGKILSGKNGRHVADGPFAESKEAIGGYFLLDVPTEEEALEIARRCPALEHGVQVEVRRVAPECATLHKARELAASASA